MRGLDVAAMFWIYLEVVGLPSASPVSHFDARLMAACKSTVWNRLVFHVDMDGERPEASVKANAVNSKSISVSMRKVGVSFVLTKGEHRW